MLRTQSDVGLEEDASGLTEASRRVIETTVDLARAEVRLALSHTRHVAIHAVTALLIVMLGAALLQVTVMLAVLAPLIGQWVSVPVLLAMILLPALLTAIALGLAFKTWGKARKLNTVVNTSKGGVT